MPATRHTIAGVLGATLLMLTPDIASAQNPYFRAGGNLVTTQVNPVVPFGRNFATPAYYPNAGAYPGYAYNPYGSNLNGGASVISAQGQYLNDRQNALLTRQQVKQSEIDTQRRIFDERMYELANTPSQNQIREGNRQLQVQRALSAPPINEIASGYSINTLLTNSQLMTSPGATPPMVPIPDNILAKINVTPMSSTGTPASTAMLKFGGKLSWPFALQTNEFASVRKSVDTSFAKSVEQFNAGQIDADLIISLSKTLTTLQARVKGMAGQIDGPDFIEARKFLNQLESSVTALKDPELSKTINAASKIKGANVAEVIDYMSRNGLKFAPAMTGEEGAYFALHQAFASYNVLQMNTQQASRTPAPKE